MADWPMRTSGVVNTGGAVSGSSTGTTVSGSASADTKGSWVEFFDSLPFDCHRLLIDMPATVASSLIDIGIGGSGSEVVIVDNIQCSRSGTTNFTHNTVLLPLFIPAGTRVAVRAQHTVGGSDSFLCLYAQGGGYGMRRGYGRAQTYGANTGDSGGVSVDSAGTTNNKGSWHQITSGVDFSISEMVCHFGNQDNFERTAANWLVDIGIGPPGSEEIIIADYYFNASGLSDYVNSGHPNFAVNIPEGTRVACRQQCSITDGTDRTFDFCFTGVG